MTLHEAEKNEYKSIRKLYLSAFPAEERAPFFLLRRRALQGRGELLTARENGRFVGFTYNIVYLSQVYLFYFAVAEDCRGQGCGSTILGLLREYYKGKDIFLAREQLDDSADNSLQRVRRHEFYLRNGFSDLPYKIREADMVYDLMSTGRDFAPSDYNTLISRWAGPLVSRLIKMEAFK